MGGTQSLHTNGFDEALSLPTESAARIALRTQQVIAFESGVVDTVDPLGGSFFVETLTTELETKAWEYIRKIDDMGGAVAAIEAGYIQQEIADAAYRYQSQVQNSEKIIVGVNKFQVQEDSFKDIFSVDDSIRNVQMQKLEQLRSERNQQHVDNSLQVLKQAAIDNTNLMPCIIDAVEHLATLGEVADVLRGVFGEYK
jgi:methylmalonyl-CoA mutase N-terminal domain/subunit